MARLGYLVGDLAVKEMETWGSWKRQDEAMTRLRSVAMTLGPLVVRIWWRSLSKTTSRTQWKRPSIP